MNTTDDAGAQTPAELLAELRALLSDAERMAAESISEHTTDAMNALRARYEKAREQFSEFYESARTKVRAGAERTDLAIRANPYQSLVIAAAVGLFAGILLSRCNNSCSR